MVEKDELVSCFLDMNIDVSDAVLAKCLEICQNYNLDAETLCDQWWAFTASKLSGAAPTLDYLEQLERKELQKSKNKPLSTPKRSDNSSYSEYGNANQSYITTPKSATKPALNGNGIQTNAVESPSTSTNLSVRYSNRGDMNKVLLSYGPDSEFKRGNIYPVSIKNALEIGGMKPDFFYMCETMGAKASSLDYMTNLIGNNIAKKFNLTLTKEVLHRKLGAVTTYGRIVSDSDGKINAHSVLLEGSRESNMGHTTILNLNSLPTYSLFPGQVIAVEGNNLTSTTLVAEKIYCEVDLDFPPVSPVNNAPIQIMVASGPFTLQDNLSYEPLDDLLAQVNKLEPNVLILLGPFLDGTHDCVANGTLTQTFDSFFEGLVEKIVNSVRNGNTRIVMVSSAKDAHHHPIYPTPPYRVRELYNNLTFVSDPCLIDVNGFLIGATTADVLFHISSFELFVDKSSQEYSNRMSRIAAHILNQQNFYPLYPAAKEMHIDHELFTQYGMFKYKPHLLILPSNLRHFVKDIKDCLVVNPERLTKGFSAGTYAKIQIRPGEGEPICNRTSCQIVKI